MIVNSQSVDLAFRGFQSVYSTAYIETPAHWERIAMRVASSARSETYGWLGGFPSLREWIGPRHVMGLKAHGFTIENRKFESTVAVRREDFEDDRLGIHGPVFQELGQLAKTHGDELIFELLKTGFATPCYDGQNFFDTDHPVAGADGSVSSVSNFGGGSGTPWFLLDCSRAMRPVIFQERTGYELTRMDRPEDENVFSRDEFVYGVRARVAAGFGLWQLAYASKETLDATAYAAARAAMMSVKTDEGRALGVSPNLLVVPPALEAAARDILLAERNAAGGSNIWHGSAELIVSPLLA